MRPRHLAAGATAVAVVTLAACSSPASSSSAPPATQSAAAAVPSGTCTVPTFSYLVRTTEPGVQAQAQEIGNCDLATGHDTLADFQQTAGQAEGECTTIAKAADNPGYNPDATPAAPLKHVIESAGPGC